MNSGPAIKVGHILWTGTPRFRSEQEIHRKSEVALARREPNLLVEIARTKQLLGCYQDNIRSMESSASLSRDVGNEHPCPIPRSHR
jgi:hypothetical protein